MVTRVHVLPYLGQHVVVRTGDGAVHHGILHSVTNDGILLRPVRGRLASAGNEGDAVVLLGDLPATSEDLQQIWSGFWFFPWWWIGGFWPWGLWW